MCRSVDQSSSEQAKPLPIGAAVFGGRSKGPRLRSAKQDGRNNIAFSPTADRSSLQIDSGSSRQTTRSGRPRVIAIRPHFSLRKRLTKLDRVLNKIPVSPQVFAKLRQRNEGPFNRRLKRASQCLRAPSIEQIFWSYFWRRHAQVVFVTALGSSDR